MAIRRRETFGNLSLNFFNAHLPLEDDFKENFTLFHYNTFHLIFLWFAFLFISFSECDFQIYSYFWRILFEKHQIRYWRVYVYVFWTVLQILVPKVRQELYKLDNSFNV